MAQKKISELTAVVLASGSAVLPIVQDGTTSKITFANLTGSILNVATAVTASHALTALSASYAVSASHEITYELSASFAETATSASHALTASFATTATSASYATTASHASSATFAAGVYKDSGPVVIGNAIGDISVDGLSTTVVNITALGSSTITGSLDVNGTAKFNGGVTGSFSGSFTGNGSGLTEVTASRLFKAIAPIYVGTQQNDSLGTTEMAGDSITIRSNDDTSSTPLYKVSNTGGTKLGVFGLEPGTGEVYLSAFNGGLNLLSTTGIIKVSGSLDIRDSLIVQSGASGSFSGSFTGNGAGLTEVTASVASDLYKPSGSISVGIGAESNIIQISGSLIQLGNPTLYTQTLVSRRLDVSGSLVVHNQLGYGFAGIGVDNAGDAQIGANNYLNILLKSDGTTTIYNGVHISASISVDAGSVLTLKPVHPLPTFNGFPQPTGSFAVSASNPVKPYFWDGSAWNPLY